MGEGIRNTVFGPAPMRMARLDGGIVSGVYLFLRGMSWYVLVV